MDSKDELEIGQREKELREIIQRMANLIKEEELKTLRSDYEDYQALFIHSTPVKVETRPIIPEPSHDENHDSQNDVARESSPKYIDSESVKTVTSIQQPTNERRQSAVEKMDDIFKEKISKEELYEISSKSVKELMKNVTPKEGREMAKPEDHKRFQKLFQTDNLFDWYLEKLNEVHFVIVFIPMIIWSILCAVTFHFCGIEFLNSTMNCLDWLSVITNLLDQAIVLLSPERKKQWDRALTVYMAISIIISSTTTWGRLFKRFKTADECKSTKDPDIICSAMKSILKLSKNETLDE
uniref:Uncharacterized protein n=1 Tax=Panagrolaimus sp. JU765 TaxID=591449 RepID=A0AC34RGS4_9BILA